MNNLEALKTIKEECEKHEGCEECQFMNGFGFCGVSSDIPQDWELGIVRYFE